MWPLEHNGECRALVSETEAYLLGHLAEQIDSHREQVPVWGWTNLLAHASKEDLLSERRSPRVMSVALEDGWSAARSFLAGELVDLAETHGPLGEIQEKVLVPLELELSSSARVEGWTPSQWVKEVRKRLGEYRRARDRVEVAARGLAAHHH